MIVINHLKLFEMKKLLFIAVLGVICALSVNAQDSERVGGIRFGYHRAAMFIDGDRLSGTTNFDNFYIGFFRDNKIAPLFSIGTGLEYFQNGAKVDDNNKRVLHTVSIPVNLKVKVGPVFGLAGFGANFKVSEKVFFDGTSTTPDENDKTKVFDAPFILGAGAKIAFISLEGRYHWGLLDVNNGSHNQYFQLGLALSF